ncbi:MAG TPA: ABC transporter permease [Thioploca sp.]|nr:MAG: ABC transporter permease [Gammaproteobacteria bacterium]HDN25553.1 ABC transporter permease [Thioploca sp.]
MGFQTKVWTPLQITENRKKLMRQILTLAALVVQEALRTRFFAVIILWLFIGFGLALFVGQVAIIERIDYQSSLLAAFLRLGAVYIVSLFVITSMVHEFNNHIIYVWLSLPLPRSAYFLGKFSGFVLVACITAILFGAALLGYAPYQQVGLWTVSLFCELLIITALSLWCVLTFSQTIQAFSAVLGFYILARSINAIQLMASGPLNDSQSWVDQFINGLIELLTMLLPHLERFTQSEWLVYHTGHFDHLVEIVVQTIIYVILLVALSLFDLYRKNF